MNIQMKVRSLEKVRLFIKRGQIRSMTILLVYALRLSEYLPYFLSLADKIILLWKNSGRKATVNYLKECVRATVQYLAGQQYIRSPTAVHIALAKSGLPAIIPGPLRVKITCVKRGLPTSEPINIARCTLSILSVWRTIRVKGTMPDMATVTSPYTGTIRSLISEVRAVQKWFPALLVKKGGSWRISETSGPNAQLSTWGSIADVFAFVYDFETFAGLLAYARKRKAYSHMVWLWCLYVLVQLTYFSGTLFALWSLTLHPALSLLLGTFYIWQFYQLFRGSIKWCTGRLAVFDEGGGKVRIVAILDAWSQWLLKPLHDGIYDLLGKLPTDGTMDQTAPLHSLMEHIRLTGSPAYSFDLTAATDRIPLWLQMEVLHMFKFNAATEWGWVIAHRPFRVTTGFKDSITNTISTEVSGSASKYGDEVRYAVGQPMGAYSSWAVMALTHHVIVQIAAHRVGYTYMFRHYALLGDDIVIADKSVAEAYLQIMKDIGVGVNRLKSIESDIGVAEFAKRWVHPHLGEFSPIGARLLLSVIKNSTLIPALFAELGQKGIALYPSNIDAVLLGLNKIRGKKTLPKDFVRDLEVAALAPNGVLKHGHMITEWLSIWIRKVSSTTLDEFITKNLLMKDFWDEQIRTVEARPIENWRYFVRYFWRTPVIKGRITAWLLQPMVILSPGFWLYATAIVRELNELRSYSIQMYGLQNPHVEGALDQVSLSMLPEYASNRSIDWRERGAVAKHTIALKAYRIALSRVSIPDTDNTGPLHKNLEIKAFVDEGRIYDDNHVNFMEDMRKAILAKTGGRGLPSFRPEPPKPAPLLITDGKEYTTCRTPLRNRRKNRVTHAAPIPKGKDRKSVV